MPRPPGLTASLLASGVALAWSFLAAAAALAPLAEATRLPGPAGAALALGALAAGLLPWRGRRLLVRAEALAAAALAVLPLLAAAAAPLRLRWFQVVPPGAPASAALDWLLAATLLVPAIAPLGLRLPALAGCVAGRPDTGEVLASWLAAHALGVALGAATGPALLGTLGVAFAALAAAGLAATASLLATRAAADPPAPEPAPLGPAGALLVAVAAWAGVAAEPLRRVHDLAPVPALVSLAVSAALAARLAPLGSTWAAALVTRTAWAAATLAMLPHAPPPVAASLLGLGLGPLLAATLGRLAAEERTLARALTLAGLALTAGTLAWSGTPLPSLGLAGVPAAGGVALALGALYAKLRVPAVPRGPGLAAGLAAAVALLAGTASVRVPVGAPHYHLYTDQPDESLAVTRQGLVTTIHADGVPRVRGPKAPAEAALGHLPWLLRGPPAEGAAPSALLLDLGTGAAGQAALLHGPAALASGVPTAGLVTFVEALFGTAYPGPFRAPTASLQVVGPRTLLAAWPEPVGVVLAREAAGLRVTRELAAAAAGRLEPGGVLALALDPEQLHPGHLRGAVRAVLEAFDHLALYGYPEPILLASRQALPYRLFSIHQALERPGVFPSLERAGLPRQPTRVLGRRLATTEVLRAWAGPGPVPTDWRPEAPPRPLPPTPEDLLELYTTLATHPYAPEVLTREDMIQAAGDGGVVLPTARVHLDRNLAAITHDVLLRRTPLNPLEPRARPEALAGALTEWRGRIPDGSAWLRSWPSELLPDPHARHQSAEARLKGTALLSGHELRWGVYPLEEGARYRALATWSCAIQNRSHVLRIDFPALRAGRRMVLETIEGVACLHPGPDGGPSWDHLVRRAPSPGW